MLRLYMLPLLAFAVVLAVQPVEAQELRDAITLEQERAIPDALLAAEAFVTITADGSAEVFIGEAAEGPTAGQQGSSSMGAWSGRGNDVIYDAGPLVNCPGCTAGFDASRLQTSLQMNTLGANVGDSGTGPHFRIADDFIVPEGATWHIETMQVFGYQTGSDETSSFETVTVRIWDGFPDASNLLFGDDETNRMIATEWTEIYRDSETNPGLTNRPIMVQTVDIDFELTEGHYFIDWQMTGTIDSGPWQPPITIQGECVTGDAWQLTSTGWNPWIDSGTSECAQGAPFVFFGTETTIGIEGEGQGTRLALESVHPNPVVGSATLNFTLPTASAVDLGVYDLLGRRVAVAAEGQYTAGSHSVSFDSAGLASGIYVVRLAADGEVATRRVTVAR